MDGSQQSEASVSDAVDETGLTRIAGALATKIAPPFTLFLEGDLGAGKTTFARALIRALGHGGSVKSPSYGLLELYSLESVRVLHLDLYRVGDPEELEYLGLADLIDEETLLLVEWPEHGGPRLPKPDATLRLEHSGNKRRLSCHAHSSSGNTLCHYFDRLL